MVIKRLIIGMVAFATLLSFFYLKGSDQSEITSPSETTILTKVEITPNIEKEEVVAVTQKSDQRLIEPSNEEVDFFSVAEVFAKTEEQALELLARYKFHEFNDSAESQFSLFEIRMGCLESKIETQEDLDRWVSKYKSSLHKMDDRVISMMLRLARCREVISYVGYEEIQNIEITVSALNEASEKGHPLARLMAHKNNDSLSVFAVQKLFDDAYNHVTNQSNSAKPEFYTHLRKADFYNLVRGYVNRGNLEHKAPNKSIEYMALTMMMVREQLLMTNQHNGNLTPLIQRELQTVLLPTQIDEIFSKEAELFEAMENGDWSWLIN